MFHTGCRVFYHVMHPALWNHPSRRRLGSLSTLGFSGAAGSGALVWIAVSSGARSTIDSIPKVERAGQRVQVLVKFTFIAGLPSEDLLHWSRLPGTVHEPQSLMESPWRSSRSLVLSLDCGQSYLGNFLKCQCQSRNPRPIKSDSFVSVWGWGTFVGRRRRSSTGPEFPEIFMGR